MSDQQPDVTFVIAAYNAEATIARAIQSALAQQRVSVEVIVADDRSSDRTAQVASAFGDERVRVVTLPQNRGPGGARNAGFAAARGRWIAVLDSDDTVRPHRLAAMIARAEAAGAEIAVDNLKVAKDGDASRATMFPKMLLARYPEITLANFIASNIMFESTFSFGYMKPIFRRQFLERHGLRYDETLRIGEDYVLLASALAKGGRCVVEPEAGYVYHIRDGSISRVLELRHVEAMLAADAAFLRDHQLDAAARAAQARRTRSLEEAASFLTLVDHLKARSPLKAVATALRDPAALRHLKMPIAARLRRLAPQLSARKQNHQAG
ncbi:succinoglycan biosynthesis protein ExoO [Mesorhizobium albiziae]|uniref:Succinoglycan biosynthesis protein ExoO n=1 Tax=Neomesorhizobium albiziae TaxID=335020 RepID=A0A1I3WE11_9HYPH|nr:glycosyltransferase family 2 protein [Mesorhizobium albiziae]GLS31513.1 glycosyl transferase [Mesorhizobium albiziae]SFK05027.1 succinoglycan biosynthesis protein ExoO [Mesorhizobium albiziae]